MVDRAWVSRILDFLVSLVSGNANLAAFSPRPDSRDAQGARRPKDRHVKLAARQRREDKFKRDQALLSGGQLKHIQKNWAFHEGRRSTLIQGL
jgi:hypothetical protein